MNDSPDLQTPWGQATAPAATAEPSHSRRRGAVAFDNVPVDVPGFFDRLIFLGSEPKRAYVEGTYDPNAEKRQRVNKDGVPVWTVELRARPKAAVDGTRRKSQTIKVSVASVDDPAAVLEEGDVVALDRLRFGVTGVTRKTACECGQQVENKDFVIWWMADQLEPASATAHLKAAAS